MNFLHIALYAENPTLEYLIAGKKEAKEVKQLLGKVIDALCDLEKEL